MSVRTFEAGILASFISYQKNLRIENLDIAKEKYQKIEKRFAFICKGGIILLLAPSLVIFTVACFYKDEYLKMFFNLYNIGSIMVVVVS